MNFSFIAAPNFLTHKRSQNGQGIIVVDAGGGTIDLSAYYMTPSPASFEEIAPTECEYLGLINGQRCEAY
jgi:hypothetical protein